MEHWGDADRHGAIAGTVAAGRADRWADAPGFWSGIGERTLKYSAWGDGYDEAVLIGNDRSWVVWYRHGQELCGVLAVEDDDAYQRGQKLLEARAPFAEAVGQIRMVDDTELDPSGPAQHQEAVTSSKEEHDMTTVSRPGNEAAPVALVAGASAASGC